MELSQWGQEGQHLASGLESSQQGGLRPARGHKKWAKEERLKASVGGLNYLLDRVGFHVAVSSWIFPGATHLAQFYQGGTTEASRVEGPALGPIAKMWAGCPEPSAHSLPGFQLPCRRPAHLYPSDGVEQQSTSLLMPVSLYSQKG